METAVLLMMLCADHPCQLGSPFRALIFMIVMFVSALIFFTVMGRRLDKKRASYQQYKGKN